MKAIIIDDEPGAIDLLKGYLENFESIEFKGSFRNGLKALEFLSKESVDIVFLDIEMPHITGISLSKILDPKIKVVFISAHSRFALESYEVNATDYLLKPISFERFTVSINKILKGEVSPKRNDNNHVIVKSGNKVFRILPQEILYLQKDGNYIYYVLENKKVMARESIPESLSGLTSNFVQSHRSFIVNLNHVRSFDKDYIYIKDNSIPLSDSFRENIIEQLKA